MLPGNCTVKAHTIGGWDGASRSDDGPLDLWLSSSGTAGIRTNPGQLFAAGWSACFVGAIKIEANKAEDRATGPDQEPWCRFRARVPVDVATRRAL
jgi:organic hydroperoxide reductase OsmC/OhrA